MFSLVLPFHKYLSIFVLFEHLFFTVTVTDSLYTLLQSYFEGNLFNKRDKTHRKQS